MLKVGDWVKFKHWMEDFGEFEGEIVEIYTILEDTYANVRIDENRSYSPNINRCKKVE